MLDEIERTARLTGASISGGGRVRATRRACPPAGGGARSARGRDYGVGFFENV
jgi:hypothetical protein